MPSAVVLLSGGLDSAVVLAIANSQGFKAHALTVAYGQRHAVELEASKKVARALGAASHQTIAIPLDTFGGSALTDDIDVPLDRPAEAMEAEIPVTYVPARNTVFLSLALAYAETKAAHDLFLGVNAVDYSGYPDCRPEFLRAFEDLANLATKAGVEGARFRIHAPLVKLSKAEIIRHGLDLGVDFSLTHSCYAPSPLGKVCGRCDSCLIRARAFAEIGLIDPAQQ
ncbi:MAG TPA: 7-cyano-7-deazaguanine synthase QueC [Fimbriimonadaceae bacterium]|nr:7-cyano-7-deazaguanine synthase QueC [Fimbriimonadaceae bacterium]